MSLPWMILPPIMNAATSTGVLITLNGTAVDVSNATTYSFAAVPFGDESSDRLLVVSIGSRANAARSISSISIGGATAVNVVTANDASGGSDVTALYLAVQSIGTVGTVSVTFSDIMLRAAIGLYSIIRAASGTATATTATTTIASNSYSTSLNVPANGGAIGSVWGSLSLGTATVAWTGLTEDFDVQPETPSNGLSGAHTNFTASQIGLSVVATSDGTLTNGGLVVAAWGP